ncbi:MAG: hypothetical protein KA143_05645, partial [Saprospiraceae bacterium]|nr:hypothetical protein [Saprospiraceae bacterium]
MNHLDGVKNPAQTPYLHHQNPMFRYLSILLFFFLLMFFSPLSSQDLESLQSRIQSNPIKISGLVSMQSSINDISGIAPRYNPFTYRMMAMINIDIWGIQSPFSFIYANGNSVYRLPSYAFYGLSPSYKWAKLHVGDRTMSFSPYTLNGHMFRGVGMELKPGRWRIAGMHGQLKRAVAEDRQFLQGLDPAFRRIATGMKLGYETNHTKVAAILFHADDRLGSFVEDSTSLLRPADNLVLGLEASHQLGPVRLQMDLARNYLTRDKRSSRIESDWKSKALGLFQPGLSSSRTHAFNIKSSINIKKATWTMGYERVDPGYFSLGSLFFQNDFENITTGVQWPMFKQKLNLAVQSGFQRTNLANKESNNQNRWLVSANASYNPSARFNSQLSYSNFNHTTRLRSISNPLSPIDSLSLISTQKQISGYAQWSFNKNQTSILGLNTSYQVGQSILNDLIQQDKNEFLLVTIFHQYRTTNKWQFSTGLNFNASSFYTNSLRSIGPSIQINKIVLENKLNLSLQFADSEIYQESSHSHRAINLSSQAAFTLGTHSIQVRSSYINRSALGNSTLPSFR